MALSFDSSNFASSASATSQTASLTTTLINDLIIAAFFTQVAITSINDNAGAALTWTRAPGYPFTGGSNIADLWWAVSPGVLTADPITVTTGVATFITLIAFGVNGANTVSPFDATAVTGATDPLSINISSAAPTAMVVGNFVSNQGSGTGYTQVEAPALGGFLSVEYQIVSTPQTGLSVALTGTAGSANPATAIAIKQFTAVGGDTFGGPMHLVQMKRKSLGWTPPLGDHRRRILRPNRSLWTPQKLLLPKNFKKVA